MTEEQPKLNRIGFDNLLEDIFGLNIRALKTIGILFRKPAAYFKAALSPEWQGKYTPSFRVWFGIIALLVALNFLYNNDNSAMTNVYESMMEQVEPEYVKGFNSVQTKNGSAPIQIEVDTKQAAKDIGKWVMVYYPFAYIPMMALAGIFVRFWGRSLTYVTRLRYLFAVVIPSSTITFFTAFLVLAISAEQFSWLSGIAIFLVVLIDFITSYRGPFKEMQAMKRLGRSLALTLILFTVYLFGSFFASLPALAKTFSDNTTFLEQSETAEITTPQETENE